MSIEKLKLIIANNEHGELMVVVATAIFINIFSVFTEPESWQEIMSWSNPIFSGYILVSGLLGVLGVLLMKEGLKRMSYSRSNREYPQSSLVPNAAITPDDGKELNIVINRGGTQISIRIGQGGRQ